MTGGLGFFLGRTGRLGMLHLAVACREPSANFLGIVVEWAVAAFVGDAAVLVKDVETFGPGRISVIGGIGHLVDAERHGIFETMGEIVGDGHAIGNVFWLSVTDVVALLGVGVHTPFVGWMRFADVDGQKVDVILVVVIELNDIANLATERRSSKAAENQHQRAAGGFVAQTEDRRAIESNQ